MLYLELCTCKVVMRETTGGRAGTQPAACSSPLRTPLTMKANKKIKKRRRRGENSLPCTGQKLFQHHELQSPCNNFPTIVTAALKTQQRFHLGLTQHVLFLWQKGNCSLKCIQLCVLILFLLTYFHPKKKSGPDLIMMLQQRERERESSSHVCLLCTDWSSLSFHSLRFRYHMI